MRILSAAPSSTEIIYALGLEDRVVGTTSLCDYPAEAREKPGIGGWSREVNYEKVEELEPDIVLLSDSLQDGQKARFQERGIETFHVSPGTLDEVFQSILAIGRRFDREDTASELVNEMKQEIEEIHLEKRRIYCEEWTDPPMVSGNWIPGLVEAAGGEYFIEDGERSREFDLEKLKQFDPEYIFLNVCGAGENISPEKILEREEWQSIEAVKNNDVYVIDDALLNRPGTRLVGGLKAMEDKIKHH